MDSPEKTKVALKGRCQSSFPYIVENEHAHIGAVYMEGERS